MGLFGACINQAGGLCKHQTNTVKTVGHTVTQSRSTQLYPSPNAALPRGPRRPKDTQTVPPEALPNPDDNPIHITRSSEADIFHLTRSVAYTSFTSHGRSVAYTSLTSHGRSVAYIFHLTRRVESIGKSTARVLRPTHTVHDAVIGATFLMLIGVPHTKVYTPFPAAIKSKTATMRTQVKTTSAPTMDR